MSSAPPTLSPNRDFSRNLFGSVGGEMDQIAQHFKKGYKTTEFWAVLGYAVLNLVNAATGLDLDAQEIISLGVTVATYGLGRSFLKGKRVEGLSFQDN